MGAARSTFASLEDEDSGAAAPLHHCRRVDQGSRGRDGGERPDHAAAGAAQSAASSAEGATGTFYDRLHPGMVGAFAGAAVGVMGGIIGAAGGALAPRGRAKSFVVGLFGFMIVGGVVLVALGVGALLVGAPGQLACSFIMPGGLAAVLAAILLPVMLMRHREAEVRRLEAEAFRAG